MKQNKLGLPLKPIWKLQLGQIVTVKARMGISQCTAFHVSLFLYKEQKDPVYTTWLVFNNFWESHLYFAIPSPLEVWFVPYLLGFRRSIRTWLFHKEGSPTPQTIAWASARGGACKWWAGKWWASASSPLPPTAASPQSWKGWGPLP